MMPNNQPLLIPINPRELAQTIALDWWAALKLYDDGWLSFSPAERMITDAGMETEFVFLGSLVAAGCDPPMLKRLLADLEKPYQCDIGLNYYDFLARRWRLLPEKPETPEPDTVFEEWLDDLVDAGDAEAIQEIIERAESAKARVDDSDEGEIRES